MLTIQIVNIQNEVLVQARGADCVTLVYRAAYREGDRIILETDTPSSYLIIRLEDTIAPAFVYMDDWRHEMTVPHGTGRVSYSPKSFSGATHLLTARTATREEIAAYKNVAFNPLDCHENSCLFPHSAANVETRGEAVFASRNAIDGIYANDNHGEWPYQSWGINRNPDAEMKIYFGRPVSVDKAILTLRADFPHDSFWERATLEFSDGSKMTVNLTKTAAPQPFTFAPRTVTWVLFKNFIKTEDDSPFPALTQIEIWGNEV
jgi:hypothetical protein